MLWKVYFYNIIFQSHGLKGFRNVGYCSACLYSRQIVSENRTIFVQLNKTTAVMAQGFTNITDLQATVKIRDDKDIKEWKDNSLMKEQMNNCPQHTIRANYVLLPGIKKVQRKLALFVCGLLAVQKWPVAECRFDHQKLLALIKTANKCCRRWWFWPSLSGIARV